MLQHKARQSAAPAPSAAPDKTPPLVFVERVKGAMRLAAISAEARRVGLAPGLTLADARARIPALEVADHDPVADAALLERIADDCDRWTPMVALDGLDGLVLDITGCAHLFGDEAMMRARVMEHLKRHGLTLRAVVAGTPEAARALARSGKGGVVPLGWEAEYVAPLPIALLGLPEETITGLSRAGLKTIGDLARRPGTPLAARFGEELLARLRRTLGQENVRIAPRRPLPACITERRFAEPIGRGEDVEGALNLLIQDLSAMLETRGEGGRAFEATFFRTDGAVRRITVETALPSRETPSISRLFKEKLDALADPLDPGFGFDLMRLAVLHAEAFTPVQVSLDGRANEEEEVSALIDRLTARLGRDRVLRFVTRDTHNPHRAASLVPANDPPPSCPMPEEQLPRPLLVFSPPQPIEVLAEVPDGSPLRFRWRRLLHEVVYAEGPERIAAEWWRREKSAPTRDYYRVENRQGRRFWLFRAGLYDREPDPPRWFLHGLFP